MPKSALSAGSFQALLCCCSCVPYGHTAGSPGRPRHSTAFAMQAAEFGAPVWCMVSHAVEYVFIDIAAVCSGLFLQVVTTTVQGQAAAVPRVHR